jgi:hypothetical protein
VCMRGESARVDVAGQLPAQAEATGDIPAGAFASAESYREVASRGGVCIGF